MCQTRGKCMEGPHCVSELANQQSKHSRQLTSSAVIFGHGPSHNRTSHALRTTRKMIETPTCRRQTHNLENVICTSEHHRNTQTLIHLSQSNNRRSRVSCKMVGPSPRCDRSTQKKQTATRDCPRCWKENKPLTRKTFPQRNVQPC